jgi:hypothetical protein
MNHAAAILDNQALYDLTTNMFRDKVVEITSIGERDVYRASVEGAYNGVAQGISCKSRSGGARTLMAPSTAGAFEGQLAQKSRSRGVRPGSAVGEAATWAHTRTAAHERLAADVQFTPE